MKIKKLLLVLLAVLLVFSLFGCGKKEPVEDVEPQDTTEQLDENIKNDISGTYELSNEEIAKYYEYGYLDAKGTIMQSIQSLKSKAKACAEKLGLTYSDAQAFNLFAYGTAIEQTKKLSVQQPTSFTPRMDFNSLSHGVSSMRLIQGYPFRALEMLVKSRTSLTLPILEHMKVDSQMIRFMTLLLERTRLGTLTTMKMYLPQFTHQMLRQKAAMITLG